MNIYELMYKGIAKFLPLSHSKINVGQEKIRWYLARHIARYVGDDVNIEQGAVFSPLLSIGCKSGIGRNCEIHGEVVIGENVLTGPEVVIYTVNHAFKYPSKNIIEQGFTLP